MCSTLCLFQLKLHFSRSSLHTCMKEMCPRTLPASRSLINWRLFQFFWRQVFIVCTSRRCEQLKFIYFFLFCSGYHQLCMYNFTNKNEDPWWFFAIRSRATGVRVENTSELHVKCDVKTEAGSSGRWKKNVFFYDFIVEASLCGSYE